jgi:hypothetical protein
METGLRRDSLTIMSDEEKSELITALLGERLDIQPSFCIHYYLCLSLIIQRNAT